MDSCPLSSFLQAPGAGLGNCGAQSLPVKFHIQSLVGLDLLVYFFTGILLFLTYVCNSATQGIVFMAISNLILDHTFPGAFQETRQTAACEQGLVHSYLRQEGDRARWGNTHQLLTPSCAAAFKTPVGSSEDGQLYFDTVPQHLHQCPGQNANICLLLLPMCYLPRSVSYDVNHWNQLTIFKDFFQCFPKTITLYSCLIDKWPFRYTTIAKFMFSAFVTFLRDDIMTNVPSPAAEFVVFWGSVKCSSMLAHQVKRNSRFHLLNTGQSCCWVWLIDPSFVVCLGQFALQGFTVSFPTYLSYPGKCNLFALQAVCMPMQISSGQQGLSL